MKRQMARLVGATAFAGAMAIVVLLGLMPRTAQADFVVSTCDEAALENALAAGGNVTFNCGAGNHVITFSQMKVVTRNVAIDGGGVITFSGGNATRLFSVTGGVTMDLSGLTLRDTNIYTFLMNTQGGALFNNGTLNVRSSTFISNAAGEGGALANFGVLSVEASQFISNSGQYFVTGGGAIANYGVMTVTRADFVGNAGSNGGALMERGNSWIAESNFVRNRGGGGGAIYNFGGSARVERSTFDSNQAFAYGSGGGGGIFNWSTLSVVASTFISNSSNAQGGALYQFSSIVLLITDTSFISNSALTNGGALYVYANDPASIAASTFAANRAGNSFDGGNGGALANDGMLTLLNSTISGNRAVSVISPTLTLGSGGGITNTGALSVVNSTFADNVAGVSGGSIHQTAGTAVFRNSLVSGSSPNNCAGATTVLGHNLESGDDCGFDLHNLNPLLGPLANNGGPTLTRALLGGSPAIDAGDNVGCPPTDQRGVARPQDGNLDASAVCDIGAFEFAPFQTLLPLIRR